MQELIISNILAPVIVGFASAFVTWYFTRKKNNAEVETNEIENVEKAISIWRKMADDLNSKNDDLRDKLDEILEQNEDLKAQNSTLLETNKQLVKRMSNLEADHKKLLANYKQLKQQKEQ